jgi:hypothetical protein
MTKARDDGTEVLTTRYVIRVAEGDERIFDVHLDARTLGLRSPRPDPAPAWTQLQDHQCPNCPLEASRVAHCPVAVNLVALTEAFGGFRSFQEVTVRIEVLERTVEKATSFQEAAAAIMGMVMVASGCPVLDRMRPLVRTHLPFASPEETVFRFASAYFLAQYSRFRRGGKPTWDLKELKAYFGEAETVNRHLCQRLNAVRSKNFDVSVNAVNVLNASMTLARLSIEEEDMADWVDLFGRFWP